MGDCGFGGGRVLIVIYGWCGVVCFVLECGYVFEWFV